MYFARGIREEPLVSAAIARAIEADPRLEAVIDGLKWRIAQAPFEKAEKVQFNGRDWYMIKAISYGPGGKPSVTFLYSVSEHEIQIVSVKVEYIK